MYSTTDPKLVTDQTTPRITIFGYDTSRRLTSRQDVLGGSSQTYDPTSGEIATMTDPLNHVTTIVTDPMGRMTSRTTPDTYSESWVFNNAGLLASHTDKMGTVDKPGYDPYGRGLVVIQSQGLVVVQGQVVNSALVRDAQTIFDAAGRAVSSSDFLDNWTLSTLDSMGRAIQTTDAMGNVTKNTYDDAGQMTASLDPLGFSTKYQYDLMGRTKVVTDPLGKSTTTAYDNVGNVLSVTAPLNRVSSSIFDPLNRVTSSTDAGNHTTLTSYYHDGRVMEVTDPNNIVTHNVYDLEIKKIYITTYGGPLPQTVTQTIDAAGNVVKVADPLTHATTYTLDAMDRVTLTSDALGHTNGVTFNNNGDVTKQTDGLLKDTTYTIDLLRRTSKVQDASGVNDTKLFNADDQVVQDTDGRGDNAADGFNPDGDNTIIVDAKGAITQKIYNADNLLIALIDPLGNKTAWEYNADGQKTKETDANNNSRTWTYDDAGRVATYVDKLGREKDYFYFNNDLLQTETDKISGTVVNTKQYTYNADDQILSAGQNYGTGAYSTIGYHYDPLGRRDSQTDVWGQTLTYTWDAGNRLTNVTDSLGGSMTYTPDDANRVTRKSFTNGTTQLRVDYTYNDRNQVTLATKYRDTAGTLVGTSAYGYDDAGKTNSIVHKDATVPLPVTIDSFSYLYDNAGNITQESSTLPRPTKNYTYDKTNQVTGDGTTTYAWDANGNSTAQTITTNNQLQSDGNWNYTYDAEGNETQKIIPSTGESWQYTYDIDNRLTKAEHKPSLSQGVDKRDQFVYDVLGNRIQKSVGVSSPTITDFSYDENGNAWADLTNTGSLITRRLYNDAVDSLLAKIDASTGNTTWYLTDVLGSVRDLANTAGTLVDHFDYSSFGKASHESSDRYGWTGRERDVELDLQYNRARYYDANTGRWISQDPLGFDAGDSNLYRYANNGPAGATDPTGLVVMGPDAAAKFKNRVFFDEYWFATVKTLIESNKTKTPTKQEREDNEKDIAVTKALIGCRDLKIAGQRDADVAKYLKVNVYYVMEDNLGTSVVQFFQHATEKAKSGSFNLFIGHGAGKEDGKDVVDAKAVTKITELFQKPPWKNQNIPAAHQPKFAVLSCFGGIYNAIPPLKDNQMPGMMTDKGVIMGFTLALRTGPQFRAIIDAIAKRIQNKQETVLNLYFDYDINQPPGNYPRDKDGNPTSRFKDWKID